MSKKPSLYVVERKEVVILVILFVLVTILSFTVGVKYGEEAGRSSAVEEQMAGTKFDVHGGAGGTLTAKTEAHTAPHGKSEHKAEGTHSPATAHSDDAAGGKGGHAPKVAHSPTANSHGETAAHHTPAPAPSAPHGVIGKPTSFDLGNQAAAPKKAPPSPRVDTDEYLLNALKEAGINNDDGEEETPPEELKHSSRKLPPVSKTPGSNSSHYVIQVGSFPTETDAKKHVAKLRARRLNPRILPSVEGKGGRWFRVAIGKFKRRSQAIRKAKNYRNDGMIDNFFVRKVH